MDSSPEVVSKEEGIRLLKAGQVDDSIRILEEFCDKHDDHQAWAYLGAAFSQKGDKMQAIHAFEESLRLKETSKAYYNLAVVYESVGRIDEAVREYRMATELDPNYNPAQEALVRLANQFAGAQTQAAQTSAGAATQVMTTDAPSTSQTQAIPGPPPDPAVGEAPAPLQDPFAQSYGPPPTQADLTAQQMAKEQEIADQHHKLMKNGLIYGAICGSIFFILAYGAVATWFMLLGAFNPVMLIISGLLGGVHGSLVGLWVGYTSGGDGAGFVAGAVLGALVGIVLGILTGSIGGVVLLVVILGIGSGICGMIIGKMVDVSISG